MEDLTMDERLLLQLTLINSYEQMRNNREHCILVVGQRSEHAAQLEKNMEQLRSIYRKVTGLGLPVHATVFNFEADTQRNWLKKLSTRDIEADKIPSRVTKALHDKEMIRIVGYEPVARITNRGLDALDGKVPL